MDEYINSELVENTYLFCVKRISDSDAAKDLSQDILYEAIRAIKRGARFVSFYSWYWQMAKNKCADYISHKRNPTLPIETAGGAAANIPEPIEKLIAAEEISRLNFSLSRLASDNREIIIRFYLKEQPVAQIARELGIPVGTVKRRLFDSKKKLKERLNSMENIGKSSYAPVSVGWFGGGSARNAFSELNRSKIAQQICVICRSEAKAVNEIADEMGVAPIYLEEVIDRLIDVKLLKSPVKDKYATNCCVFPSEVHYSAGVMSCREFRKNGFNERVSKILFDLKDEITALDFYGNTFDYKYLMWILYVIAGDVIGKISNSFYIEKYNGRYKDDSERDYRITIMYQSPDENPDYSKYSDDAKSAGWSNLHSFFDTAHYGKLEYANLFEWYPFPAATTGRGEYVAGRDNWVDGNNISLLLDLAKNPEKELNKHEQDMAAAFVKNGLLEKTDSGLKVTIPIFSRETYHRINEIVSDALRDTADEFQKIIGKKAEEMLLPYVRKDLMGNFIHWDMSTLFQSIEYLLYYGMYESDSLAIPEDYSRSAAGLCIITD